jgi:hypothetical protein
MSRHVRPRGLVASVPACDCRLWGTPSDCAPVFVIVLWIHGLGTCPQPSARSSAPQNKTGAPFPHITSKLPVTHLPLTAAPIPSCLFTPSHYLTVHASHSCILCTWCTMRTQGTSQHSRQDTGFVPQACLLRQITGHSHLSPGSCHCAHTTHAQQLRHRGHTTLLSFMSEVLRAVPAHTHESSGSLRSAPRLCL